MAKQKIKNSHWGTVCTEVEPNCWEWKTGEFTWQLDMKVRGLNFFAVKGGGVRDPLLHFDKVNDAVMFTLGYSAGEQFGRKAERQVVNREEVPE